MNTAENQKPSLNFTGYQKFVIAVLGFLQFTIILDFMIMSPLGAILMPALKITPSQFGLVVSAYAFSAGISGILSAGFVDRFDRKKTLLFFYSGFVIGTLFCGLAPTFHTLLAARVVTGIFAGMIGATVLAITTDLFSFQMRGRVMGILQTAFAASQILGLPVGLYISNLWGWHSPFLMIVAFAVGVGVLIVLKLKPIDTHLKLRTDKSSLHHLKETITNPRYLLSFAVTGLLSLGGFMLMPFGSAFTVHNLGIDMEKIPLIYMVTGFAAIFVGPLVGKLSDTFGKYRVFLFGTSMSMLMVVIYTHLGVTPLWGVIAVNALMFVGIFSRMIPAQALMSAIPDPASRGSFMAVGSSIQQIAGGLGSAVAGLVVTASATGAIEHFDILGFILVGTALVSAVLMYFVHRSIPEPDAK